MKIWGIPSFLWLGLSGVIWISGCTKTAYPVAVESETITLSKGIASDSAVEALIAPFRQQLAESMDETIIRSVRPLTLGSAESTLGNMLADLFYDFSLDRWPGEVDFLVLNKGGLRIPDLPEGNIIRRHFYELLPFENEIYLVAIPGRELDQLFNFLAAKGGWPISHTARFVITGSQAESITIHGIPVDTEKIYHVAMPDYVANGGDDASFLKNYPRRVSGILMRDMAIEGCRQLHQKGITLDGKLDGRVTLSKS
jgi:2',3'-cyclic-nucleotide 2'-phosphodiesterase (5'-nucleotidase family)